MGRLIQGTVVVEGRARGRLLVSAEPLSFWGGYDPDSGEIIDRRHPLSGHTARGHVLALPETRGSSTTTAILLEAVRQGNQPAALITRGTDAFLALASVVADELYGTPVPMVSVSEDAFGRLEPGARVEIDAAGRIRIEPDDSGAE